MSRLTRTLASAAMAGVIFGSVSVWAHLMTIKGTVAALEPARIQVKTGEEKGATPGWYPIGAKTKILRGKKVVTFTEAKMSVGERVVLNVDHASDGTMTTLEILLSER